MWRFWLSAYSGFAIGIRASLWGVGASGKIAGTTDISLIFPHFSSGFKVQPACAPELTKPVPSTIVPAKSIGSCS
jgi:hypothetical protein